ncbi:MAG: sugar phosphate isomerase/epimerase family protein [Armatimonadota bacterium]|nr:sugar phosphate isomerase/epimerase family protein [Armatimonadota bacterium]
MKNKLGCSTHSYSKYSLERALDGIAKCGLKYVELAAIAGHTDHVVPEQMSEADYAALNKALAGRGLTAISISGHVDPTKSENIEKLKNRIVLANKVGAKFVNTLSGHPHTEEETKTLFAEMRKLGDFAKERDVTICFETHGGIMGKSVDCRRTIEAINHPNIRINYDPANIIYFIGDRPEDDIHGVIGLISHFHIKDKIGGPNEWNFPAIGTGTIDFTKVIGPLMASGYTGPFSFELEFTPEGLPTAEDVDAALAQSVAYIERLADANGWS